MGIVSYSLIDTCRNSSRHVYLYLGDHKFKRAYYHLHKLQRSLAVLSA